MTSERADSAVAPMSDERLAEIRQIAADSHAVVARHLTAALNELLAEVDRLNTVLDANRVVRNAAESSSRTYKGAMELVKAERTRLRAELDKCAGLNISLVNENTDATTRAETAERELAELRERIGEQREEWGVRTYDSDDDTEVMRTREQAEDLAAAWRTEIPGSNPTVRVRTQCAPGPWRDVEGGEWKAADGA